MSQDFCRDVLDPWGCSKSLCKKSSCAFLVPQLAHKNPQKSTSYGKSYPLSDPFQDIDKSSCAFFVPCFWYVYFSSETGRIRFRGVRFQTPSSVSFLGLTEFRGENSVSSSRPILCLPKRTHRVFPRTHRVCPKTQWGSVSSLLRNSTLETVPCPSFPCFFGKSQGKSPKRQGFFIPTEPLKSLERKGKILKKTRNSLQGKKQGISKKQGKEGQGIPPVS